MIRLHKIKLHQPFLFKAACVLLLTSVVMMTLGCSQNKPKTPEKPLESTSKKPPKQPSPVEEPDDDFSLDQFGSSKFRRILPLSGTTWEWEGELDNEGFVGTDNPSAFKIEFKQNGWFAFQADCQRGTGIYEINGEHIALAVIKASHMNCGHGSRANDFQHALESLRTFRVAETKLFFDAKRSEKTMVFHLKP